MKISTKIFICFSVILLLFSIATIVNFQQSQEVKENSKWVSNSQLVIRHAARLQRNITDIESDLRGFLLTNDTLLLKSYDSLNKDNKTIYNELRQSITNASFQKIKLDTIMLFHELWKTKIAEPLITAKLESKRNPLKQFSILYNNEFEKKIRSKIISEFKEFNNYEYELRDVRKARLNLSVSNTREISFLLTIISIIIGIAVAYYLARIITKRINQMVNLANGIANGNFDISLKDTRKDELSDLSFSLNRMAHTLSENISELEKKNKELNQFAYVVSHDLKAPLRGMENVSLWIEEDLGNTLSSKMKEYLDMMKGRIKRMENLIDGILEVSRIGRAKRIVEHVDVKLLLKEIVEMLAPPSELIITINDDMPVLNTERISLHQIFSNLISNSIKYHNKINGGKIKISCKDIGTHYQFSVEDDGPGISSKYHGKIFIIFQTLKERDAFESTGVGLAIVKKILDDKKCSIKVISEEGKGAIFIFTWPKRMDII